jgi:hypothetical protein
MSGSNPEQVGIRTRAQQLAQSNAECRCGGSNGWQISAHLRCPSGAQRGAGKNKRLSLVSLSVAFVFPTDQSKWSRYNGTINHCTMAHWLSSPTRSLYVSVTETSSKIRGLGSHISGYDTML